MCVYDAYCPYFMLMPVTRSTARAAPQMLLTAALVAAASLVAACGDSAESEVASAGIDGASSCEERDGGSLRIGVDTGLATFDINENAIGEATVLNAESLVFDRLLRPTPDLSELEPRLATSVEPNADFTEWTIKLRRGVKFHDGSTLDAKDVVFTIEYYLQGANGFAFGPVAAVEAVGPLEVRIALDAPYAELDTGALSSFIGSIIPADFGGMDAAEFWRKPIGTGPYEVETFEPGTTASFTRFEDYWEDGKPHIDEIEMRAVPDSNDRVLALEGDEFEFISSVPPDAADTLADGDQLRAIDPTAAVQSLFLTSGTELVADPDVREAITYALDREAIVDGAHNGRAEPTADVVPSALPDTPQEPVGQVTHDLQRAQELMAQSSFPEGGEIETIYIKGDASLELAAQIVRDQLGEVGIDAKLLPLGFAEAFDRVQQGDYEMFVSQNAAVVIDPVDYLGFYVDTKGYYGNWPTSPVEKLLGQYTATDDPTERVSIITDYLRFSTEQAAQIPMITAFWLNAQSENLSGLDISPINEWYLADAWLCA